MFIVFRWKADFAAMWQALAMASVMSSSRVSTVTGHTTEFGLRQN